MKRNARRILLFVLTLVGLLAPPALTIPLIAPGHSHGLVSSDAEVYPQTSVGSVGPVTTTILSNDPNSSDWTIDSPVWSLKNGVLDGSGLTGYLSPKIISSATFSSDRTVELDFRTVAAGDQTWYTAWILGKYANFYDKANLILFTTGALQFAVSSGGTVNYYNANATLGFGQWHHAKIVFAGNTATVYVNGTLFINITDPIIGALGDSPISLASWGNSESQFSSVTVTGSVLPDEPPIAGFNFTPHPAAPGQAVSFDPSPSNDPDGYITGYTWNFGDGTSGVGPYPSHTYGTAGNYTATLTVTDTSSLSATASHIVEIVSPLLALTPSNGPVGTKVLVQGSRFPASPSQSYGFPTTVEVTFDDQFIGYTTMTNTTFNFTFNVPVSQPGLHQIHAYAQLYPSPAEATANFTVTQGKGAGVLTLATSVGSIYFPGDSVTVYVLSSLNGNPNGVQMISLILLLPNGTTRSLSLSSPGTGLYSASYSVPATNSMGTYALIAIAHLNNINATALTSFEVKPTWLQANGRSLTTATSIAGAVGAVSILGVAWRKGYFTKRKDDPTIF